MHNPQFRRPTNILPPTTCFNTRRLKTTYCFHSWSGRSHLDNIAQSAFQCGGRNAARLLPKSGQRRSISPKVRRTWCAESRTNRPNLATNLDPQTIEFDRALWMANLGSRSADFGTTPANIWKTWAVRGLRGRAPRGGRGSLLGRGRPDLLGRRSSVVREDLATPLAPTPRRRADGRRLRLMMAMVERGAAVSAAQAPVRNATGQATCTLPWACLGGSCPKDVDEGGRT